MTNEEYFELRERNKRYIDAVAIVRMRLTKGYTITDMANLTGVKYNTLRKIELCECRLAGSDVSIPDLLAIANTLECDLFSIVTEKFDTAATHQISAMIMLARNMKRYAVPAISTEGHRKNKILRTKAANNIRAEKLKQYLEDSEQEHPNQSSNAATVSKAMPTAQRYRVNKACLDCTEEDCDGCEHELKEGSKQHG